MTDRPLGTFGRFLWERSPTVFRAYWGRRWMGTMGLLYDATADALRDAWAAPLQRLQDGPAYDALRPLGQEMSLPQYGNEDWVGFRSRIQDPWDTWSRAGSDGSITGLLEDVGFPGGEVELFTENGSASEFIVRFPLGTHNAVTGEEYGDPGLTYGQAGLVYGPGGLTADEIKALRGAVLLFKPAEFKCPYIIFDLDPTPGVDEYRMIVQP